MFATRLKVATSAAVLVAAGVMSSPAEAALNISQNPLFAQAPVAPLNMLVVGRDHKLWYEAYNDASDLNADGALDVGYRGYLTGAAGVDYYGYFDSFKCYSYSAGVFTPTSNTTTKRCSGAWSGDFLNYLTTSRIDALRKVLYGGKRSTDIDGSTILERSFVPQDAHSWGKEYTSTAVDGYNIAEYAPLSQPTTGRRHLFANTSLTDGGEPLLRVLENSTNRIWEWVSIERPVAGDRCGDGGSGPLCVGGGTSAHPGHPGSRAAFDTIETTYATAANRFGGTTTTASLNCNSATCNPWGAQDNFMTIVSGELVIKSNRGGTYNFKVDGDDVIDFTLRSGSQTGTIVAQAGCYNTAGRGFGACGGAERTASVTLANNTTYYWKFRHEEQGGGEGYQLFWAKTVVGTGSGNTALTLFTDQIIPTNASSLNLNGGLGANNYSAATYNLTPALPSLTRTDYIVRVEVCKNATLAEANCRTYSNGNSKPTGLLHDYGEANGMMFGLITGSYFNNTEGGVLRRAMSQFGGVDANADGDFLDTGDVPPEVLPASGRVNSAVNGVIATLDKLRIKGFRYSDYVHSYSGANCPALGTAALTNGECPIWGNPIAEMMYESMRYFAGASAASTLYATGGSSIGTTYETELGLPSATWDNPYVKFPVCAKPFQTVISDINPSYDTGLPGNPFGETAPSNATPTSLSSFNVATTGQTIWTQEIGAARNVFIGDVNGTTDSAPSSKSASSFGNIRGLSPEEPTKKGSYYAASVANFGLLNDLNAAAGDQKLKTYSVALASPLPRIEFPVNGRTVTLVPFAKSVSGAFSINPAGTFQPTNTIVDFYVQKIVNTPGQATELTTNGGRPYAVFRINYEDVEQGNDHDMDAIVRYEVLANADNTVTVNLTSEYAAGSADQHIGYVMSGTTADGIYLEVRDVGGGTTNYRLDTPANLAPGACNIASPPAVCANGLTLSASRTFTPGTTAGATLLKDPLWYAAKYGGFKEPATGGNNRPDVASEWDTDNNGTPDNYFLVTNASTLSEQLRRAFDAIAGEARATGGIAVAGVRVNSNSLSFEPRFNAGDWTGDLRAYNLTADGRLGSVAWNASEKLPAPNARNIYVTKVPGDNTTRTVGEFTLAGLGGQAAAVTAIGAGAIDLGAAYRSPLVIDDAINYLRGTRTYEETNNQSPTGGFRKRETLLGDIIGSRPEVANPNDDFGYSVLPSPYGAAYTTFLGTKASRTPVVYVNANDGMLHGFNATRGTADSGKEVLAFMPSTARAQMASLLSPSYVHRYLNDGRIVIGDAYLGSGWKTALVSSVGAGGRSVFALDISTPNSFGASSVLWELSDAIDADIGTAIGAPTISLLNGDRWVAIFGNGYNSVGDDAKLFIVDLASGSVLAEILAADGDAASPNGIGNVAVVDTNDDGYDDTVYGGDFQGNLWKFDVSSPTPGDWGKGLGGNPLFIAKDAAGTRQPITGDITVGAGPGTTTFVYFGTGRYFTVGDNVVGATPQVQSFYSIRDNNTRVNASWRGVAPASGGLVQQTITLNSGVREVSANAVDLSTARGWYMDLKITANSNGDGERFVGQPLLVLGRLFFLTFKPDGTTCDPGGINRLYFLDALTGAANPNATPTGTTDVSPCERTGSCEIGTRGPPIPDPTVVAIGQNPQDVPGGGTQIPGNDPQCAVNDGGTPPVCLRECQVINPSGGCTTMCPIESPFCVSGAGCRLATVDSFGSRFTFVRPCGRQSWRQVR